MTLSDLKACGDEPLMAGTVHVKPGLDARGVKYFGTKLSKL